MKKNRILSFVLILVGIIAILLHKKTIKPQIKPWCINSFNYENRCTYITSKSIIIGNNNKEIQNEYYDLKIEKQSDSNLKVFINKLWIDEKPIKNIDPKYTIYICEYITKIIGVPLEDIVKIVCENYFKVKQYKEIEKIINYKGITIKLSKVNNQLVMEISREDEG